MIKYDPENNQAFAYIRVSSERQTEGMSLEEQTRQVKLYAERQGLEIVKEFVEVDSASELDRPKFTEMVKELREGQVRQVIFHSVDRSARNPYDQATLYELMNRGEYQFHFVAEGLSTLSHSGRSMLLILWGMASSFTENLKFHVNKGLESMVRDGRSPNAAPIGYIDSGRGIKTPDPRYAPLIRKSFELYASGNHDINTVTEKMIALGLRNKQGAKITPKTMYKILRKKFYYGVFKYRGTEHNGSHEPIITKQLFDKVQAVLNKKSYKKIRTKVYIFQQMVLCPNCNKPMRSVSAKKVYKYYNCKDSNCTFRSSLKEEELEGIFSTS